MYNGDKNIWEEREKETEEKGSPRPTQDEGSRNGEDIFLERFGIGAQHVR